MNLDCSGIRQKLQLCLQQIFIQNDGNRRPTEMSKQIFDKVIIEVILIYRQAHRAKSARADTHLPAHTGVLLRSFYSKRMLRTKDCHGNRKNHIRPKSL